MNLNEQLTNDMKSAMKAKASLRLQTIRSLKAAIKNEIIQKGNSSDELTDSEIIAIIRKQAKQRNDSITQFDNAGRVELADVERNELVILEEYLPKSLSEEELHLLVTDAVKAVNATSRAQMGAVMQHLKETTEGRVDGKVLSQSVIKALS